MIYRIEDTEYVLHVLESNIAFYFEEDVRCDSVISKEYAKSILIPYIERRLEDLRGIYLGTNDTDNTISFIDMGIDYDMWTPNYSIEFDEDEDHSLTDSEIQLILEDYINWFRD